jgi:hypothetical protein
VTSAETATLPPARYRHALVHVVPNAMGGEFGQQLGGWFHANRRLFVKGGDGVVRRNYELVNVGDHCPMLAPFHARLVDEMDKALTACHVDPFDLGLIEVNSTLYHHGARFGWHDDSPGYDGRPEPTRRVSFCYYMHSDPRMFRGGELEFLDGTVIEPANDTLVMFHPLQRHRVRQVECWSCEMLHGRWALMGWVHSLPAPTPSP